MTKAGLIAAASLTLCLTGAGLPAQALAEEEGLAGIHDPVRVKGKVCFSGHHHSGSGSGKNQKLAMADAIGSWQSFTAWEYGRRWGSWKLATDKSAQCSGVNGQNVVCQISALPCRPGK